MSDQDQGCPHPYEDAEGRATACPQCAIPTIDAVAVDRAVLARAVEALDGAKGYICCDCEAAFCAYNAARSALAELRPLLVKP